MFPASRAVAATVHPRAANTSAAAWPIPDELPVINTTLLIVAPPYPETLDAC